MTEDHNAKYAMIYVYQLWMIKQMIWTFFTIPAEFYDKVEMIFKLIKDDKLDEVTRAELLKREPLAKLIEVYHKQFTCNFHDHLERINFGPRNQVSELEMESKEREKELSAIMKKLEDTEKYDKEKQLRGAKAGTISTPYFRIVP